MSRRARPLDQCEYDPKKAHLDVGLDLVERGGAIFGRASVIAP
jgi:hypothetical protein